LKSSVLPLALGLLASISYLVMYLFSIGWPFAALSAALFAFRAPTSLSVLVSSKLWYSTAAVSSLLGTIYLLLLLSKTPFLPALLPLSLEIATASTTVYLMTRLGKTKQPSPLDMPVYG
jgi:hypothetical protein